MIKSFKNLMIAAVASCAVLAGCGGPSDGTYMIYHTDVTGTRLTVSKFSTQTKDTVELVKELLAESDKTGSNELNVAIKPDDVKVENVSMQEGIVIITFSDNYNEMDKTTEAMYRTALVKTVYQIEGVEGLNIRDSKGIIKLASGVKLENLKSEDYIDESNDLFFDAQWKNVGLYFTDKSGDKLIRTDTNIAYNNNESIEKMIVSRLVDGPVEAGLYPVIPEDTKLLGVSVREGVCYVNFDSMFANGNVNASGNLPVYAVVNSLCELNEIKSVRIMIDGNSDIYYRENLNLNQNLDFDNSNISE